MCCVTVRVHTCVRVPEFVRVLVLHHSHDVVGCSPVWDEIAKSSTRVCLHYQDLFDVDGPNPCSESQRQRPPLTQVTWCRG